MNDLMTITHPFIQKFKGDEKNVLLNYSYKKTFQKNEKILSKGVISNALIFVLEGALIYNKKDPVSSNTFSYVLEAPAIFNQASFLQPRSLNFDLYAGELTTCLFLERKKLEEADEHSFIDQIILQLLRYDLEEELSLPVINHLQDIPPNGDTSLSTLKKEAIERWLTLFSDEELKEIEKLFIEESYEDGEVCLEEGENVESFFILLKGELISEKGDIALQGGDSFGQSSLLFPTPAPSTLIATQSTLLFILDWERIEENSDDATIKKLLEFLEGEENVSFFQINHIERVNELNEEDQPLESSKHTGELKLTLLEVKDKQIDKIEKQFLLCLIGLSFISFEYLKSFGFFNNLLLTSAQIAIPLLVIHYYFKESILEWGFKKNFLKNSILQAFICILSVSIVLLILDHVTEIKRFQFYHQSLAPSSLLSYFLFVCIQEWLKRGVVLLSIQKGLKFNNHWVSTLLSSALFFGFSGSNSLILLIKEIFLGKLFLAAPHLIGIILIHFILGLLFAV